MTIAGSGYAALDYLYISNKLHANNQGTVQPIQVVFIGMISVSHNSVQVRHINNIEVKNTNSIKEVDLVFVTKI